MRRRLPPRRCLHSMPFYSTHTISLYVQEITEGTPKDTPPLAVTKSAPILGLGVLASRKHWLSFASSAKFLFRLAEQRFAALCSTNRREPTACSVIPGLFVVSKTALYADHKYRLAWRGPAMPAHSHPISQNQCYLVDKLKCSFVSAVKTIAVIVPKFNKMWINPVS